MLAPNAPLREAVTAYGRNAEPAQPSPSEAAAPAPANAPSWRSPARYLWAILLARLFESLPLVCPHCGADMRIIAFVTEASPVQRILTHLGEPAQPPPLAPARGPPAWDGLADAIPDWDALAQPEPEDIFDQQVQW